MKSDKERKKRPIARDRKRTPTVYQMEVNECGAAALSMIMQYYGKYVPPEELRVECGVSRNGCNAKNIYLAAERYKMKVTASRRDLDRMLEKSEVPCMLHWNFSHFVVFEGMRLGRYCVNDPQRGRRRLTYEEMEEGYSGTVLEFEPDEDFVKSRSKRTLFRFTLRRLKGQHSTLIILFLIGIATILPGVLTPVFSQVFLDDILIGNNVQWTKWLLIFMFFTALFDAYFTYLHSKITLLLRTKLSLLSTDRMIGHMLRLPMVFFEQRFAGDLVQRINNNVSVCDFLSTSLIGVVVSMMTSIVYLIIMICYSPALSAIGVLFSAVSVTIALIVSTKIRNMAIKFGMDTGKLVGSLYNGLGSSASLKAVGAENEFAGRVLGYYAEVNSNDQKLGRMQSMMNIIPKSVSSLNNVVLLILGSVYVVKGELTPGMMMSFTGFLASFSKPFESIVTFVRGMQQVKNDMARVEDIMNYAESDSYNEKKDERLSGQKLTGEVLMEDISFSYGKLDKPFIRRFNMHVRPGGSVAIVGGSGSGKSTISKLASGLYTPWTGRILMDGVDVGSVPADILGASIAVVTQDISLFDGSIYDNITTWNTGITQEEVVLAARDAQIHEDIILKPGGYDYMLRENGSNISGGQRQRIEIAKALAINPTMLILDEATSSLDSATEKKILDNIKRRRCTCIVVAHRLSTIRDCDEIIVMKNGFIKERGTHDELIEAGGLYKELVAETD
ncbi:MAG: NHLP family bacteriocin export ABC transporter peptidase/permease/ATPase subunit [Lachnospiraceae bacterium]|nr:NHLP family bacteriocin export ABC transporter peptidase/permease/ATPase subunit [Lachnospiraceae bacterium]